jgi:phage terminase large subunit GpA-like protein
MRLLIVLTHQALEIGSRTCEYVRRRIGAALRPPPLLTVSEWADRHRILHGRASSEPGPWRTSRTPYLRDIMDALSAIHPAQKIVLMKGAQVGGTEAGNNWIGYVIHHVPRPMLAVQPTVQLAKRFSRQRIDPLIRSTPVLRERVAPARSRDSGNTLLSKEFPNGILVMTGANSAVGLRQMPAQFLFFDEVDAYDNDVDGEGDPIALAEARAQTYGWRRKVFLVSTPTIAGVSRIEFEYLASDQRRYFVPCPHCGTMQVLTFERLRWERGKPDTVRYYCESCDGEIQEHHKTEMLANGEWRATAVAEDPNTIGFHLSALYSPVGWLSWAQIARKWDEAQGKPEKLKTFRNTILGETWQEQGDAPDWERLIERREDYQMGVIPREALVLTAGVDVQDDRLECDLWAWSEGYTSWLVDHLILPGGPREAKPWDALAALLARDWPRDGGGTMRVAKACVDTGGRDTAAVYGHLRRLRDPRIAPTKGVDGWNRAQPVQGPTLVDALVDGRKLRRGLKLWTVSVSTWKIDLYRRLWLSRGDAEDYPPGWVHLPRAIDAEWVKQLVSEQLRTVKDRRGFARQEWAKLRDRNEALDCAVLARAALWLLGADRYGERFWKQLREQLDNAALGATPLVDASAVKRGGANMNNDTSSTSTQTPPTIMRRPNMWLSPRSGWLR